MAGKMLSVDVGEHLVHVCQFAKRGKGRQLGRAFVFQTPDRTVSEGQITDPVVLGSKLREMLHVNGMQNAKNVTFSLTTTKVASREVTLPPVKEKRLDMLIRTNAPDYFPVDLTNYQVAYLPLEKMTEPEPALRVLVLAVPQTVLLGYARLAEAAGLTLDALDYAGNAQYQVLKTMRDERARMYVHVGTSSTMVTFMQNGVLLLQRSFGFGGDELVEAAKNAASLPDDQYLEVLGKCADRVWLNQTLSDAMQADCLDRLISGILRTADFLKSNHPQAAVHRVVLTGACSRIAGLNQRIADALGLETEILTQLDDIQCGAIADVSPFITCIGSALAPLGLIPDSLKVRKKGQTQPESVKTGVIIGVACTALAVALTLATTLGYFSAKTKQAHMQRRMEELAHAAAVQATYMEYSAMRGHLAVVSGGADAPNAALVPFFEELERKMPSSILLLSAVCNNEGVTMHVTVPGMEEAAVVIAQLRSFESIQTIVVDTITETADEMGITTASFTISGGYGLPAAEADAPTQEGEIAE